jgi:hypothetical protein
MNGYIVQACFTLDDVVIGLFKTFAEAETLVNKVLCYVNHEDGPHYIMTDALEKHSLDSSQFCCVRVVEMRGGLVVNVTAFGEEDIDDDV